MYTLIYRIPNEDDHRFAFRRCTLIIAGRLWFMRQDCSEDDYVYPVSRTGINEELDHMTIKSNAEEVGRKLCEHSDYEFVGVAKGS